MRRLSDRGLFELVLDERAVPDYRLRIGDAVIAGRDEQYLPAVQSQFEQFPGLTMTIHRVIASPDRAALWLLAHAGRSVPHLELTASLDRVDP